MATQSILNKNKSKLKYLHKKSEMLFIKFKESGCQETKERYFDVTDTLAAELDKYYSNYMMFLKIEENPLFEAYLGLSKETVKNNLLSNLIKELNHE